MGGLSLWHWIIVLLVVLILFGRGRISEIMGDFGKGIKSFKEGINDESGNRHAATPVVPPVQIAPHQVVADPIVPPVATPAAPVATPVPASPQQPAPTAADPKTGV